MRIHPLMHGLFIILHNYSLSTYVSTKVDKAAEVEIRTIVRALRKLDICSGACLFKKADNHQYDLVITFPIGYALNFSSGLGYSQSDYNYQSSTVKRVIWY